MNPPRKPDQTPPPTVEAASAGNLARVMLAPPVILNFDTETPVQETARLLYTMGLNPLVLLYGKKEPCFKWTRQQATRLHLNHPKYGLHAVFAGRCNIGVICGRTSQNLFILDSETPEQHEYHKAQLRARGIPIYESFSSRGGHLWLRCIEGEVGNIPAGILPDMEIRGRNCYVVAPPSVHPTGAIYQWGERETDVPPLVHLAHIDWLTDGSGDPVSLLLATHDQRAPKLYVVSPYARKTQEYILTGHTLPEGVRNNRLFAAACDMAGSRTPEHEAHAILTPAAINSRLSERETRRTIANAYSQPREPARKHAGHSFHWQRAAAYALSRAWKGSTGTTDRAVFMALIERARIGSNDNGTFRASFRELAELARVGVNTVRRALDRLKTPAPAPLLCYAGTDKTSGATLWRFSDLTLSEGRKALTNAPGKPGLFRADAGASDTGASFSDSGKIDTMDTLRSNQLGLSSSVSIVEKTDAAERGALGKTGILIYRTMTASLDALTVREISDGAKVTTRQVYHALRREGWLVKSGLVQKSGNRWIAHAATDKQLDERIARGAGTYGARVIRQAQFAKERAINLGRSIVEARMRYDRRGLWGHTAQDGEKAV